MAAQEARQEQAAARQLAAALARRQEAAAARARRHQAAVRASRSNLADRAYDLQERLAAADRKRQVTCAAHKLRSSSRSIPCTSSSPLVLLLRSTVSYPCHTVGTLHTSVGSAVHKTGWPWYDSIATCRATVISGGCSRHQHRLRRTHCATAGGPGSARSPGTRPSRQPRPRHRSGGATAAHTDEGGPMSRLPVFAPKSKVAGQAK